MNIMAKVPQIYTIFCNKSTGQLAFFGFILSFLGSIARTATVLMETDDFMFQIQYIVGLILNGILSFQFALYWNASPKKSATVQPGDKKKKMN